MKKAIVGWVMIVLTFTACSRNANPENAPLNGKYKSQDFSLLFENGKCYHLDGSNKDRAETTYLIKKDKLYIAPIVPEGEKMIRNVWVVYTIKDGSLESSHVEDMDTGDVFYTDKTPKIILVKE